ncbi:MAG: hypothetical protein WA863_06400, partial [Methyloceanibacter sp.]
KDNPTTLYIYPESTDIVAITRAVKAGRSPSRAGLYWNASCLSVDRFRRLRAPLNPSNLGEMPHARSILWLFGHVANFILVG